MAIAPFLLLALCVLVMIAQSNILSFICLCCYISGTMMAAEYWRMETLIDLKRKEILRLMTKIEDQIIAAYLKFKKIRFTCEQATQALAGPFREKRPLNKKGKLD
jgi:hypothetical protein